MDPFAEYIHSDWDDALAELLGSGGGWAPGEFALDPLHVPAEAAGMIDQYTAFGGGVFDPRFQDSGHGAAEGYATSSPSEGGSAATQGGEGTPGEAGRVRVKGESQEGEVAWGVVGEGWGVAPGLLGISDPFALLPKLPQLPPPQHVDIPAAPTVVSPPASAPAFAVATAAAAAAAPKLHNKVEKRYRYNVKNALETLRDSVPRLRQVYGTSLPLELATTDREDSRGLMAGLEPLGKPTKKTVMLGARLYIEYLETEQRVQAVRVGRAEEALRACMKSDEWSRWKIETENQAARCRDEYMRLLEDKARLRAAGETVTADPDDDDDDEDVRPKKRARADDKKPRQPAARKARTSVTSTTSHSSSSSSTAATTAFYSFGLAYVLFPRATDWFGSTHESSTSRGKVLLPETPIGTLSSVPPSVIDGVWYVLLGLAVMGCVYLFGRASTVVEHESDDEDAEKPTSSQVVRRLADKIRLGTPGGLVSELVRRVPFLGKETSPSASSDWYKVHSAHVGGESYAVPPHPSLRLLPGIKFGWLATLHLRLRLARTASDDHALAVLYALQCADTTRQNAWNKARKFIDTQDTPRAIHDVCELPLPEVERWLDQVQPTTRPIEDIANQLVLEDLDRVLTHLYVSLIAASYPSESSGTQLASLVDNLAHSSRATHAVLADSAFKARIQRVLTGVESGSEAHVLGLVVIGLWGDLIGQEATRQRALANMLIAQQVQQAEGSVIGNVQSVDLLLALILPGYKNTSATKPSGRLSKTGRELDTIACVCLRYLLLLRSVSKLAKPDAPRQQRLRSSVYVRQACLEIRMLLARSAFDTRLDAEHEVVPAKVAHTLGLNGEAGGEDETEDAEFAQQTDRLIDLMTVVGCRAAGRVGRDDDSGIECDVEEL